MIKKRSEMSDSRSYGFSYIFRTVLFSLSAMAVLLFLYVAISRISYPFELNGLEGGILNIILKISEGKEIYPGPSLDYVPFINPPFYYYVSALVSRITGIGFMSLRLVSLISALLGILLIFLFVRHDTRRAFPGVIAAGLFAAFYGAAGGWLDVGAVDSLNLLLLLAALYVIRFYRSYRLYLLGGIFLFLAFFTNQASMVLILFILIYGIIYNRKSILPILLSTVPLLAGSVLLMDRLSDNWFSYFVFELPLNHHLTIWQILSFFSGDLFRTCMIPFGFILYYFYFDISTARKNPGWGFNLMAGAGMIAMAWLLWIQRGGAESSLLPAYAVVAALFGIGLNEIWKKLEGKTETEARRLLKIVYLLAMFQFIILAYDPRSLIPSGADRAAGQEFVESVRAINGEVFIPGHGYLAERAGKKAYAHSLAIYDVINGNEDEVSARLQDEISGAFDEIKFAAVIYDDFYSPLRIFDRDGNYRFGRYMFSNAGDFYPVSGDRSRPQYLFTPEEANRFEHPPFELLGPMPPSEEAGN